VIAQRAFADAADHSGQWDAITGASGGLTAGSAYYLDTTAGLLTTTAPAAMENGESWGTKLLGSSNSGSSAWLKVISSSPVCTKQ